MMIWVLILAAAFTLVLAGVVLLRKPVAKAAGKRSVRIGLLAGFAIVFAVTCILNFYDAMIIQLHLLVFWLFGECADGVILHVRHRGEAKEPWLTGFLRVLIAAYIGCVFYLAIGWYAAHHVWQTEYRLTAERDLGGSLRIAMISDSHVGDTFDADGFAELLHRIEQCNPDIVVVVGDFVDEYTTVEDMRASAKALGEMKSKYGVYFVYGNHDRGGHGECAFSAEELDKALRESGVHVLEDEAALVAERFYVIGRKDQSESRKSILELTQGLEDRYRIVLDHQPGDFNAESRAGVDLVLAGHTHGGLLIPIGIAAKILPDVFGDFNLLYGRETRGDTEFIVSSGIATCMFSFKTGAVSEYVIIDIDGK